MEKGQKISEYLQSTEPRAGLYFAIMERIAYAKRRKARVRTGLFAALAVVSGAALIPALQYTAEQFYVSGFYDYLTLVFSDRGFVLTYWRQFSLSLVESLPSLAILLLLPIACALGYSLYRLTQTSRVAFTAVQASA
ncbi:MAG: hypothetical protein ABSE76_03340 [Minisyncoccia bacterium]|jgi:hypothetical protein